MSVALQVFINGTSIRIEAQIQDFDSTPDNPIYLDPTTNELDVFDDDGNNVLTLTTEIARDGVGLYHVDFTLPSTYDTDKVPEIGKWNALWIATYGGLPSKGRVYFNVTD